MCKRLAGKDRTWVDLTGKHKGVGLVMGQQVLVKMEHRNSPCAWGCPFFSLFNLLLRVLYNFTHKNAHKESQLAMFRGVFHHSALIFHFLIVWADLRCKWYRSSSAWCLLFYYLFKPWNLCIILDLFSPFIVFVIDFESFGNKAFNFLN